MPNRFKRMKSIAIIVLLFALLASGRPVSSAPRSQFGKFQTGDVLVALDIGQVQWFSANGELQATIDTELGGQNAGLAFNPSSGELYVTNLDETLIMLINADAQLSGKFGAFLGGGITSIVFDRSGNVIAGREVNLFSSEEPGGVTIFDPSGEKWYDVFPNSDPTVSFDFTPFYIDLSIDQRTLFYTNKGRQIKRFDILGEIQLPDFAFLPDAEISFEPVEATNLRLLHPGDGSGGLLVADYADIKRLDEFGKVISFYDAPFENFWVALALDPDGRSFWAASGDDVYKFDIESGKEYEEFRFRAGFESEIGGLVVVGGPVAALPTPTWTPSVTPSITPFITPRTPTLTVHPPTITFTPRPAPGITPTPYDPCRFPYCIDMPTSLAVAIIGAILVAGIVFVALVVRGLRKRSERRSRTPSVPKRVRTLSHPDAGEQSVIPSSDAPSLQVRLSFKQGDADYEVESDGE